MVLTALNLIFCHDKDKLEAIESYRKSYAETYWMFKQLARQAPPEVLERLKMEFEINLTDPDFNFYKEAFGKEAKPLRPLNLSAR